MKRHLASLAEPLLFKLFRHIIPKGHDLTLERRRIYALPTRYGLLFTAMLLVMLLGSINYNNSLGFMLTFLLASLGLISILYTYRNIAHLQVRSGKASPTFAGREARFMVHLQIRINCPAMRLCLADYRAPPRPGRTSTHHHQTIYSATLWRPAPALGACPTTPCSATVSAMITLIRRDVGQS